MNERRAIGVVSTTAGILGLILALVPFNRAWATEFCGESFHGPGSFTLDSDVGPCSGPNAAIEVAGDGATLNMAGHTVSCDGNPLSIGVFVLGNKTKVSGGTVTNCGTGFASLADSYHLTNNIATGNGLGFDVEGTKGKVKGNKATANQVGGFSVAGDSNTLAGNTAANNGGIGFQVSGNTQVLKKNTANQNAAAGFDLSGDSHTLTKNTATDNATDGFDIATDSHTLTGNTSTDNAEDGFTIDGASNSLTSNTTSGNNIGFFMDGDFNTLRLNIADNNNGGIAINASALGNRVIQNKAKGNPFDDLEDGNTDCAHNTWKRNKFVTKNPACIR